MGFKEKRGEYRIYRPSGAIRLVSAVWLCIACIMSIGMAVMLKMVIPGSCLWGVSSIFVYLLCSGLWRGYRMVFGDFLIISSEGIEFHAIGRHGFVQWHDTRRFVRKFRSIRKFERRGRRSAWGIEFNSSASHSKGLLAHLFIFDDTYLDYIIPLDPFLFPNRGLSIWGDFDLKRFRQTPLGSDIYHYAPHLF